MKNFIKFLSLVLTLSMLLCLLAACKNDNGDESDTNTETETTDTGASDETELEVVKIVTQENFDALVAAINENPEISKGKCYKLYTDINYSASWNSSPQSAYGKFSAPEEIKTFPGIKEFYGVFDGNGKTISAIYRLGAEDSTAVGGFIDALNGGTVKNLTINNSYVFDANGAKLGGLVGTVTGSGASVENVTVNANVYAANDAAVNVGGIVGTVEADGFTMTKCTFGGKAGNISVDLSIPSASTSAKLAQLIGDAGDKAVALTECAANGDLICAAGATKDTYANGSAVTATDCTTTPCPNPGVVEISEYKIYTAQELLGIAAYDSTFDGSTIKLMRDIDLNEGWTAGTTAPAIVWTGITELKGTFDGNGKCINGIYTTKNAFIGTLNGGTVKNLAILNSAVVYTANASSNVGIIGTANGGTVENVYSELDIYVTGMASCNIGGIIGETQNAVNVKNIVVNGEISSEVKTVDQVIAKQSVTSVVSDILAIGTGDVITTGRTNIFTEKQASAPAGTTWTEVKYLDSFAPKDVAVMVTSFAPLMGDTTWYNAELSEFTLTTPEQLLGLSVLAQTETFENKTIHLGADIDLNANWDATTEVAANGTVTLASTPKNVWTPIPVFKGTIDGHGYSISGIYSMTDFDVPATEVYYMGGFINELVNGTVKNLIVENSLAHFKSTTGTAGTSRIRAGGFIAHVLDSTLDTLYVDIDSWMQFSYHYQMGGMICEVDTDASDFKYNGSISNIVYAGTVGRICSDGTWLQSEGSGRIYTAAMIAQSLDAKDGNTFCYITMENLSFIGNFYRPICPGAVSADVVLAYTSGTGYSCGVASNNNTYYCFGAFTNNDVTTTVNKCDAKMGGVATDYKSSGATVTDNDTYSEDEWATITIENGAGVTDPIILPKSVVAMLNARNSTNA